MNSPVKLETGKFPKIFSELIHSNQFLKMFSVIMLGVTSLALILTAMAINRPPVVLTLSPDAEVLETGQPPKIEDEVKRATTQYVSLRYKWNPSTVKDHLKAAEAFISPSALPAYQKSADGVARFSIEKQVAQRIYPNSMVPNVENKTIQIHGDRISVIQGLSATGELKLELDFELGPRSKLNPWGIYITREHEF